jgi:hypothetical protein
MASDNFTPTRVRALRECPQGQQPGEVFDVTADVAVVLCDHSESAERVPADTPLGLPSVRGVYRRRDLVAEKR